jgi:hypothetical protein
MEGRVEVSAGSVIGTDHLRTGKNNQDAYHWRISRSGVVGVVCDGCGSAKNSEVGAKIGAYLVAKEISDQLAGEPSQTAGSSGKPWALFLEHVRQNVLSHLRILARSMEGDFTDVVLNFFLFSVMGFVVTPQETVVFSAGDGVFALNGRLEEIGPFPSNAPPYLGYELINFSSDESYSGTFRFHVNSRCQTDEVHSMLIGSDGLAAWPEIAERRMPGKKDRVGPLSQFWEEDRYLHNPDMIRRTLAMINAEAIRPRWEERELERERGLLKDDTTLMVLRRKQEWR